MFVGGNLRQVGTALHRLVAVAGGTEFPNYRHSQGNVPGGATLTVFRLQTSYTLQNWKLQKQLFGSNISSFVLFGRYDIAYTLEPKLKRQYLSKGEKLKILSTERKF